MSTVSSEERLREIIGGPSALVAAKVADRLNDLTRQFVERSPFVCVATSRPGGGLDISPRGDPAGFVRIHRSVLVALPHVEEVRSEGGRVSVVIAGTELPVSRRHTRELRSVLTRRET